jgi:hypothetical protein
MLEYPTVIHFIAKIRGIKTQTKYFIIKKLFFPPYVNRFAFKDLPNSVSVSLFEIHKLQTTT